MTLFSKVSGVRCQVSPVDRRRPAGFTMIEIALCLAIIGFALVAIIGVLPTGLNVQRENREETIINQEAAVWIDAIRSGARGYDDLTNYVLSISNLVVHYQVNGTNITRLPGANLYIFNATTSTKDGANTTPLVTTYYSSNIIGLLSKPKIEWTTFPTEFASNYVVATVRALSGSATEKVPQTNEIVLGDSFTYKLIMEVVPYVPIDPNSIDITAPATNGMSAQQLADRINHARIVSNLRSNLHDVRLTFLWPYLPNGNLGNGRLTFRASANGFPELDSKGDAGMDLFFFRPSLFVQATNSP